MPVRTEMRGTDETVVLRNTKLLKEQNTKKEKSIQSSNKSDNKVNVKMTEDGEEIVKNKKWGFEYGKKVIKARTSKTPKMNQQQLAKQLNVKLDVVKSIENGTGNVNPQIASKIFKILGVKRN